MSHQHEAADREGELNELVSHMKDCRGAGAAIVVDGSGDSVVASMLAEGWTMEPQVDYVSEKRLRIMVPPKHVFEWKPWTYRSVETGKMAEDPTVIWSDNGRNPRRPGYMSVVVQPGHHGWKPIVNAESWPKPYYVRDFDTQERAIAIAEALMRLSLRQTKDYPRLDLYRVVDGINAALEVTS